MAQKIIELSDFRNRIGEYYKNIGEQMNFTANRLTKIEADINAIFKEIATIKKTTNVDRKEFHDTIYTLVESLKELAQMPIDIPKVLVDEEEDVLEDSIQVGKDHRKSARG